MGKIIKILVLLALIVVVALAGIIFTTDINQYKDQIADAVMQKTGVLSGLGAGVDFNSLTSQLTDQDALLEKLLGGF